MQSSRVIFFENFAEPDIIRDKNYTLQQKLAFIVRSGKLIQNSSHRKKLLIFIDLIICVIGFYPLPIYTTKDSGHGQRALSTRVQEALELENPSPGAQSTLL